MKIWITVTHNFTDHEHKLYSVADILFTDKSHPTTSSAIRLPISIHSHFVLYDFLVTVKATPHECVIGLINLRHR